MLCVYWEVPVSTGEGLLYATRKETVKLYSLFLIIKSMIIYQIKKG